MMTSVIALAIRVAQDAGFRVTSTAEVRLRSRQGEMLARKALFTR
jgi:hypothetical protein